MSERIQTNNMVTDSVIDSVTDSVEPSTLDKEIRINVPFPPKINPRDLITLLPDGNVPTRTPNAFIIYRKALIEAIRAEGHNLPMSSISSIASKQWYKEPESVKSEYKRLAIEALNHSNTMIKSCSISRRRKNERWNTITFNNNSMTSRKDPKRPKKLSKSLKIQSSSRTDFTPENLSPTSTINDNINDNHINDNNINDTINNEHVLIPNNNNMIDNIIGNINDTNPLSPSSADSIDNMIGSLNDTNETLSPLSVNSIDSVDPVNWNDLVYHQSPEIVSISNNNDDLLENFIFSQNFPTSLINNQPILTEVQQQNMWIENDFNNSQYYYDTNPTNQFDKNINDGFFVLPEFPYGIDTGKLCLDTLKNFNIAIYP